MKIKFIVAYKPYFGKEIFINKCTPKLMGSIPKQDILTIKPCIYPFRTLSYIQGKYSNIVRNGYQASNEKQFIYEVENIINTNFTNDIKEIKNSMYSQII